MPKVTLTSSSVAYDLYALLSATYPGVPLSVFSRNIQFPSSAFEAANAGATLKVGPPNDRTTPTDVTSPDAGMTEGGNFFLASQDRSVAIKGCYLKASVNNAVVYVSFGR